MQNDPFDNPRHDPIPDTPEPGMESLVAASQMPDDKKAALQAIISGNSVSRAAKVANIHRSTLYRWISDDPEFKNALANYRKLDRAAVREQLLSVADYASIVIRNAIRCGDVRASFALLRSLKMLPTVETLALQAAPAAPRTDATTPPDSARAPLLLTSPNPEPPIAPNPTLPG